MGQTTARGWFSRLASSAALVFAFLFALDHPVHGQLFVSFYNGGSGGYINVYNDSGLTLATPTVPTLLKSNVPVGAGGKGGQGAEGVSCLTTLGVPSLFVATNDASISVLNPKTFLYQGSVAINGGSGVAALSLNPLGSVLYAADYGATKIWALDPKIILATPPSTASIPPILPVAPSVTTALSHDVVVGPNNNVYAADFQRSNSGVIEFPSPLPSTPSPFISTALATSVGLVNAGGVLFDTSGHFWVTNFARSSTSCPTYVDNTSCDAIFEFDYYGSTLLQKIPAPPGSGPLGIAQGPDGNIYVAMFVTNSIGQISLANPALPVLNPTFMSNVGPSPKYLGFVESCAAAPSAFIEVCKASSATNPVPANGIYNFTVTGSAFSSSKTPLTVPVGECSGPIPVAGPTATITELLPPGVGVSAITAVGYSPPPTSTQENLLESFDLQTGTATVIVVPPATAGDTSTQTLVTFTNYEAPPGQLKLCKVAGQGVAAGTPFNFTLPPSTASIPVEAGPATEGGYCVEVAGTFQVGTAVTVTETLPAGYAAPAITVNGVSTPSTGCTPSSRAASPCSVVAVIGPGINEVSFTNNCAGQGCTAQPLPGGSALANLDIVNYSLVSQTPAAGTQSYMTYRADLRNTGTTILSPLIARLTSLDPSRVQVMGQGALSFAPAPANSQVTSSNTFTILTDPAVPLDFSKLQWTFHSSRSVPPRR